MSWLNAEAAPAVGPKNNQCQTPTHILTRAHNSLSNKIKEKRRKKNTKKRNGVEHATLIFIDFILTPKRQTHPVYTYVCVCVGVWRDEGVHFLWQAGIAGMPTSNWQGVKPACPPARLPARLPGSQETEKGFIMAICLSL